MVAMGDGTTLRRCQVDSPIGHLTLVTSDRGLAHVLFPNKDLASVGLTEGEVPEEPTHPILRRAAEQLDEYFAGQRTEFELPLDLDGSSFQLDAWHALADIPYGETTTYARQAEAIGRRGAFRAVGAANGANPVPIVLPCHRVVGSDGSLTGFGGGLDVKRALLDLEQGVQQLPF